MFAQNYLYRYKYEHEIILNTTLDTIIHGFIYCKRIICNLSVKSFYLQIIKLHNVTIQKKKKKEKFSKRYLLRVR